MQKIKAKDEVIVIAGKDKGKRGEVRKLLDGGRVLVTGINLVKKHTKPNPQAGVQGGIVEKEAPLALSNVAIFNPTVSKADRVAIKVVDGKKIRVFKSDGLSIEKSAVDKKAETTKQVKTEKKAKTAKKVKTDG